ncbi:MAG: GNAT family N-acetyltransferase [Rhizobiaceae bacterium]|nr:GNAT family N-acetyltransferase [Rhizobiaceae bacterium]
MLRVITSDNIDDYPDLMEKVWQFRHVQFVERLGWTELSSRDGREIDRFDTEDAIHLIAEKAGKVVGYTRLLRTSGPHLLSDVYPQIMQGGAWPRAADIYEWTRCISDADAGRFGDVQASHLLITGVLEFCLVAGIRGMIVETHPKLVTWMLETGYKVETLHTPQNMNGVPVVPVHIGATQAALDRHHRMFGIQGSVLLIDEGLANPVTGKGLLRHLPGLVAGETAAAAYAPDVDFGAMRESSGSGSH